MELQWEILINGKIITLVIISKIPIQTLFIITICMKFVRSLLQLTATDVNIAWWKWASLWEMLHAGIPVPWGFVVLSSTFDYFVKNTWLTIQIDWILDTVDHKTISSVDSASERIQALILDFPMPVEIEEEIYNAFVTEQLERVAVRSSATAEDGAEHARAGQLDSYLNTQKENVIEKIRHCWASLFTPRAIFYRFEKKLHNDHISVAVVVQKMVQSEMSWIAFSVHPVTEDRNQMIIEAWFGLGEAIVSWSVTPDSYVVRKDNNHIDIIVNNQQKALYKASWWWNEWVQLWDKWNNQILTKEQILELLGIILRIENHYGFPCDIERAYEWKKFYIVQSRPITTLGNSNSETVNNHLIERDGKIWTPAITRNMSFWHQCLAVEWHYHHTLDFGVQAVQEQFAYTQDATKTTLFVNAKNMKEYSQAISNAIASDEKIALLEQKYKVFWEELIENTRQFCNNIQIDTWNTFCHAYKRYCAWLFLTSVIGRIWVDKLHHLLIELQYNEKEIPDIINSITYPETHTPLFDSQLDLLAIGSEMQKWNINVTDLRIQEKIKTRKEKYWYIPVNRCEDPRTDQEIVTQLESHLQQDCAEKYDTYIADHNKKVVTRLQWLDLINNEDIRILAKAIATWTSLNEYRKNIFSYVWLLYRDAFITIGAKVGITNWKDMFYLTPDEIGKIIQGEIIDWENIKKSRHTVTYIADGKWSMIFMWSDFTDRVWKFIDELHGKWEQNKETTGLCEIKGYSANKGKIIAYAKVVLNNQEFYKLLQGEILVTTMTSVDFVPVMERAWAFVTNEWWITSHASIVAREMNKPCIIWTKNATALIQDGDLVEVDADNGVVRILERSENYFDRINDVELIWSRPSNVQRDECLMCFLWLKFVTIPLDHTNRGYYYEWKQFRFVLEEWKNNLITENWFKKYLERYKTLSDDINNYFINDDIDTLTLLDDYKNRIKKLSKFGEFMICAVWTENVLLPLLLSVLKEKSYNNDSILDALSNPTKYTEYQRMMIQIYQYKINWYNAQDIDFLVENYWWYPEYRFNEELYTHDYYIQFIEKLTIHDAQEELDILNNQLGNNLKKIESILSTITDQEIRHLIKVINEHIWLRTDRIDLFKKWQIQIRKLYQKLTDHFIWNNINVTYDDILYMTNYEIIEYLENWIIPDFNQIRLRKWNQFILLNNQNNNSKIILNLSDIEKMKKVILNEHKSDSIKWLSSYWWIVCWIVKVVYDKDDLNKILENDVLVAKTTFVDYTPAMKISVAFVTDEWGITSHASIVARELKKPCIVWTKIATQVLKDWDLVEVDADNGIVRILERFSA
jgi:phosphoenolpyruvate synthase/pyruvate phosphate dikinase